MVNSFLLPVLAFAAGTLAYPGAGGLPPSSCTASGVSQLVNLLKVYRATSYCSSYLGVPTSTVVSTATATTSPTATSTVVITATSSSFSTVFNKREAEPTAAPELEERQGNALQAFGSSRLSQACSCLPISTARTTTITTSTTSMTSTTTTSTTTTVPETVPTAAPGSCAALAQQGSNPVTYNQVAFNFRCNSAIRFNSPFSQSGAVIASTFQQCITLCSNDRVNSCDGVLYSQPDGSSLNCILYTAPANSGFSWDFQPAIGFSAAIITPAPN